MCLFLQFGQNFAVGSDPEKFRNRTKFRRLRNFASYTVCEISQVAKFHNIVPGCESQFFVFLSPLFIFCLLCQSLHYTCLVSLLHCSFFCPFVIYIYIYIYIYI